MTEAEWLACEDPRRMLSFLYYQGVSQRRLRLFTCACARRVWWHLLADERSRRAVEVGEQFADGEASAEALGAAHQAAREAADALWSGGDWLPGGLLSALAPSVAWGAAEAVAVVGADAAGSTGDRPLRAQCAVLREVMGNPFRPP